MGSRKIHRPTRAIILAAGFGTRLDPLTRMEPKALLPLWGVPMLEHCLARVRDWGVRDVLVNCHAKAEAIVEFLWTHNLDGLRVQISYEPDILGTGGVLYHASWFLDRQPFWLLNADVACSLDPEPLLKTAPRGKIIAGLWVHPGRGPRTVEVRRGRIHSFRAGRPGTDGTATFCGLHLVSPHIVKYIPAGPSSIITAYEEAMKDGHAIRAVTLPEAYWADIGTPDQFLDTHGEILQRHRSGLPGGELLIPGRTQSPRRLCRRGIMVSGFAAIDLTAVISPAARLRDCVIGPGACLGPKVYAQRLIAGPDTQLARGARRIAVPARAGLSDTIKAFLKTAGWFDENMAIECFLPRGSNRRFFRLHRSTGSAILVHYSAEHRKENARYASHARFLSASGVRVPTVYEDDPARELILMEDIGDVSLFSLAEKVKHHTLIRHIRDVFDLVDRLHHHAGRRAARSSHLQMEPPFSLNLYRWEWELFRSYFLSRHTSLSPQRIKAMQHDLRQVARILNREPAVLVHRDLQSSNIHIHQGRKVLIDFQGMRWGPASYDLASLLCDPYLAISPGDQQALIRAYAGRSPQSARNMDSFWWATVQRLVQVLGAYGRLSSSPGTASFARHIPAALHMLRRALAELDTPLPTLVDFVAEIDDTFIDSDRPSKYRDWNVLP